MVIAPQERPAVELQDWQLVGADCTASLRPARPATRGRPTPLQALSQLSEITTRSCRQLSLQRPQQRLIFCRFVILDDFVTLDE